jgi:hypothetical protein
MVRKRVDPVKRFWSKVDIGSADECWEWNGPISNCGYGNFSVGGKRSPDFRQWAAHRYAWFITHGELLPELNVCHKCDNRRCVNPNHLFLGTNADNVRDKVKKQRQARGSKQGHSKIAETDISVIVRLYNDGKSQREIGEMVGLSQATISRILRRDLWTHVEREPAELRPGSGSTKLTWRDVNAIRSDAQSGISAALLAQQYGVCQRHIRKIIEGIIWRQE